jgi:hypothetical protein
LILRGLSDVVDQDSARCLKLRFSNHQILKTLVDQLPMLTFNQ